MRTARCRIGHCAVGDHANRCRFRPRRASRLIGGRPSNRSTVCGCIARRPKRRCGRINPQLLVPFRHTMEHYPALRNAARNAIDKRHELGEVLQKRLGLSISEPLFHSRMHERRPHGAKRHLALGVEPRDESLIHRLMLIKGIKVAFGNLHGHSALIRSWCTPHTTQSESRCLVANFSLKLLYAEAPLHSSACPFVAKRRGLRINLVKHDPAKPDTKKAPDQPTP